MSNRNISSVLQCGRRRWESALVCDSVTSKWVSISSAYSINTDNGIFCFCFIRYGNKIHIKVYTGDTDSTSTKIIQKAKNVFNITVDEANIDFVFLEKRCWIEAARYPHFTLLGQSLGSIVLAFEALLKFQPDIYIDTMGYAFTLPVFRYIGGSKVGCYTHYPTISTDMLKRVKNRVYSYNNSSYVTKNPFLSYIKLTYYRLFAKVRNNIYLKLTTSLSNLCLLPNFQLYSCVGRCALTVMVNSSWTEKHILQLWNIPFSTHRVYPPCEVGHLKKLQHLDSDKIIILSIGQFRPEKDHPLQLQAMYELRTLLIDDEPLWNRVRYALPLSLSIFNTQYLWKFNTSYLILNNWISAEIGDNWIMSWRRRYYSHEKYARSEQTFVTREFGWIQS